MKSMLTLFICLMQIAGFAIAINPNLTAEYNSGQKRVELKWQNIDTRVTGFTLQRSADNNSWKDIYTLGPDEFSRKKQEKFFDRNPEPTKNYYRLKMSTSDGLEYSASIMVIIGSTASSWIMYPVPVRDMLNLQYNGSESIKGVVSIFIQNMYGYVLTRKRCASLNRIIQVPVDNLGRGIYDVRIVINDEIVWNQRFVK
ncbi:MAG: hypothetical protein JST82_12510 [Bacteroidetes bacterium]|nr:hypothetical protein [Bacteroidota bacterium]